MVSPAFSLGKCALYLFSVPLLRYPLCSVDRRSQMWSAFPGDICTSTHDSGQSARAKGKTREGFREITSLLAP
jgi:hypothetical protein